MNIKLLTEQHLEFLNLNILLTVPRRYFFCGSFMFFCCVFALHLCASVYMRIVDICWERADLLAIVCGV